MAKRSTILVIDREKMLVDLLTRALASNDVATLGTTSADDALQLVNLHCPGLIVVDPTIPGGFALVGEALKQKQATVVVISGSDETTGRARDLGVENVVNRNEGLDALAAAIRKVLGTELTVMGKEDGIGVLIVDDEVQIREVLSEFLSDKGYFVRTSKNGREAVTCLEEDPKIQVVLLDVSMPVMGGMEALSLIMGRPQHPSTIMMTAVADREVAKQALALGAFDYILKPINLETIETSIVACLSYVEYQKQPWWKRLTGR